MAAATTFKDKIVIITGASNGVGAATAALFAEQGAKVANIDIREATTGPTDTRIDIKCDVSNEQEVIAAVEQIVDKWGTIDVLCNVAGITDVFKRVTDTTNKEVDRIMGINFYGPLHLMRHVIPHFLKKPGAVEGEGWMTVLPKKGAIVNVCSVAAIRGGAAGALYTASKHALLGLSRNTSWMYAKNGVRTNVVIPGGVMTNIMGNSGYDRGGADIDPVGGSILQLPQSVMPAVCRPEDVARTIVYLAGADAVNGAELTIDSGWTVA